MNPKNFPSVVEQMLPSPANDVHRFPTDGHNAKRKKKLNQYVKFDLKLHYTVKVNAICFLVENKYDVIRRQSG